MMKAVRQGERYTPASSRASFGTFHPPDESRCTGSPTKLNVSLLRYSRSFSFPCSSLFLPHLLSSLPEKSLRPAAFSEPAVVNMLLGLSGSGGSGYNSPESPVEGRTYGIRRPGRSRRAP